MRENVRLRRAVETKYSFDHIVTKNPRMKEVLDNVRKVAPYKSTVLITGESGTGKELIARAVH
jgi:transcriptional regulator with PAS, ATPase and Fis domain